MILEMQLLMHIDLGRVIHFQTILSILQKTRLFTKKQWISWQIQLRVRENAKNPRATGLSIPNVKVHIGIIRKWTNKYGLFEMVTRGTPLLSDKGVAAQFGLQSCI